jgi:hypothetical protein
MSFSELSLRDENASSCAHSNLVSRATSAAPHTHSHRQHHQQATTNALTVARHRIKVRSHGRVGCLHRARARHGRRKARQNASHRSTRNLLKSGRQLRHCSAPGRESNDQKLRSKLLSFLFFHTRCTLYIHNRQQPTPIPTHTTHHTNTKTFSKKFDLFSRFSFVCSDVVVISVCQCFNSTGW